MFSQEKVNEVLLLPGCAAPSHHRQTSWYMRATGCLQPWSCPDYITVRSTGPSRYRPTRQHHACAPDLLRLSDWKSRQHVVSLPVPGSCQSRTHRPAQFHVRLQLGPCLPCPLLVLLLLFLHLGRRVKESRERGSRGELDWEFGVGRFKVLIHNVD